MQDSLTGKLTPIKKDGGSHVVPIQFVLDDDDNSSRGRVGDIIFTTDNTSVKAKIFNVITE